MKILVVDDEGVVLESCRRVLEQEGYEVILASTADKALDAVENEELSLLLVDIKMPERDGVYFIKKVRDKSPNIPIIVMTGYPTPETISEAAMNGAATLIAKPFTPDELLETIERVIEKNILPVFKTMPAKE
jgi:DNA-binding NtrC family response regulator